jgi:hypothetical protein
MMDIKEQDLIKFWTWCGFKTIYGRYYGITYPNGKDGGIPQLNLDNLYRYAIPKLQEKGYNVVLTAYGHSGFVVDILSIHTVDVVAIVKSNSPTEALYNAIMKVIDEEANA